MNEEALFETALEKPAAERAAFLAEACGADVAMRQRLETLLVAHDLAGDFLERPLAQTTETPQQPDLAAFLVPAARPDSLGRLGHYELLELLGQGGYGIVYRAFDDVLHRVVAVKVLAPHLAATSPARKRFLREARSAAQSCRTLQLDKDELQLFVDGRLVNRVSRRATPGAGGHCGTLVGGEMSRPIANLFTGKLDEVRLSRVLRYRGEFTPTPRFEPDKDTLALYHCDEGSGDKLIDCSGNGHHGKAVNVR